jgi:hypothetical protein
MQKKFEYNIGIGVTEHNRPEVLKLFLKNIKKYMPKGAKLVIIDDASEVPVVGATYRFEENAGIARSKNKCIELLQDCKNIFLFDSDCWPIDKNWYKPYIESREPHLCYIFKDFATRPANDCIEYYRDSEIVGYSHARGCMLYIDNSVLGVVGGLDTRYKKWGYEHVDYSNRIYNAGLTRFRFQDVVDSNKLIYSMDEHEEVKSTVNTEDRMKYLKEMKPHFENSWTSKEYCSFVGVETTVATENAIVTCYFTSQMDPERNIKWESDLRSLLPLMDSVKGERLYILHDCYGNYQPDMEKYSNVEFVKVETSMNPYFQRWISYYEFILKNPQIKKFFFTDATDVEMLNSPFDNMVEGTIYTGSEPIRLWNNWMIATHNSAFMRTFFKQYATSLLLNAGLLGGSREDMRLFIYHMNNTSLGKYNIMGNADMGLFNYVARTYFNSKLKTGPDIHTKFKSYEKSNKIAWFKHK